MTVNKEFEEQVRQAFQALHKVVTEEFKDVPVDVLVNAITTMYGHCVIASSQGDIFTIKKQLDVVSKRVLEIAQNEYGIDNVT